MTVGERIQYLRKSRGMSQAVSKWEAGQSTPDLDKILLLHTLFGVTTDYLLLGTQEDAPEENVNKTPPEQPEAGPGRPPLPRLSFVMLGIGAVLTCLLPLFAHLYQGFEQSNIGTSYTYASEYLKHFPLTGVTILAVVLLGAGLSGAIRYFYLRFR